MLEIYNIQEKPEFLEEIATLTLKEWGKKSSSEEEFKIRIDKNINKIKENLNNPYYCKLILVDGDTLVGFISLFENDGDERIDLKPWYATMYVKKDFRGNGYSKILNDAILKEAKKRGFEKVYLKTDLINYYEKFGAKLIGNLSNDEKLYCFELGNYKNAGKRDILIFPKFDNISVIQEIRKKYDTLANLVPPHITLAFPFSDDISNEELIKKLSNVLKNFKPFKIKFSGIILSDDNYIFLNCTEGGEIIINLHDEIYNKILPSHLNNAIKYIPHITLGKSTNTAEFKNFDSEFSTIVDTVCVELVGDNEESIIIKELNL